MTTAPYGNRTPTFSIPSASSRSVNVATNFSADGGPRNARGDPCPAHPERSPFVAERIVRDAGIDTQPRCYLHVCVQTRGREGLTPYADAPTTAGWVGSPQTRSRGARGG
jgi:hypothetical protein